MSISFSNFKHIPIEIGGALNSQSLSPQLINVNAPMSYQSMKRKFTTNQLNRQPQSPFLNRNSTIHQQLMSSLNKKINPRKEHQSNIKTALDIEIIKILLINEFRKQLAEKTPAMLFDKTITRRRGIPNDNSENRLNLGILVDRLKLTFIDGRFFIDMYYPKRFVNDLRLFYSLDLNNYLDVVTVFDNILYGPKYLKTGLKVSGFYILYNIYLNYKSDNKLKNTYRFDLSIETGLKYVFHNFANYYDNSSKLTRQFLLDNSRCIFSGNLQVLRYSTEIYVAKFNVPSYKKFINDVTTTIIMDMQNRCFDENTIRLLFDNNFNIIIKNEPGFDPLKNEFNNLEPIDVYKFIRNRVKKNG